MVEGTGRETLPGIPARFKIPVLGATVITAVGFWFLFGSLQFRRFKERRVEEFGEQVFRERYPDLVERRPDPRLKRIPKEERTRE